MGVFLVVITSKQEFYRKNFFPKSGREYTCLSVVSSMVFAADRQGEWWLTSIPYHFGNNEGLCLLGNLPCYTL